MFKTVHITDVEDSELNIPRTRRFAVRAFCFEFCALVIRASDLARPVYDLEELYR